jgi:RNA polymerase sigma factor (sigma-70 family)
MQPEYFHLKVLPIRNKLFRFACMLLNDPDEAADTVQEVLMKLWMKKEDLEKINNIEAWSVTMVRNISYDKLKRQKRIGHVPLESGLHHRDGDSIEKKMDRDERLEKIYHYLKELPQRQNQAIFLRDIEGHSYKEISDLMGIDENLVKVTLFRARENLRKKILKIENYGL